MLGENREENMRQATMNKMMKDSSRYSSYALHQGTFIQFSQKPFPPKVVERIKNYDRGPVLPYHKGRVTILKEI